ncbi:MAG: DUF2934 domain-containing protein [Acidobacteriota bacterium]
MQYHELIKVSTSEDLESQQLFRNLENAVARIRDRAQSLFESRGGWPLDSIDDWLRAERELFAVPANQLAETEAYYEWGVSLAGQPPERVNVAVAPYSVAVFSPSKEETSGGQALLCRVDLANPIEVDEVRAIVLDGELLIRMPKVGYSRTFGFIQPDEGSHPPALAA